MIDPRPHGRTWTRAVAAALAVALAVTSAASVGGVMAQQGGRPAPEAAPPSNRDPLDPRGSPRRGAPDPKAEKNKKSAEPKPIPKSIRKPGASSVPEGAGARAKLLDELYARLATAEDEAEAKRVATAIEHVWGTTGSDTVSLLMERARRAAGEKKLELAVRLLDRAVTMAPDYAEVFDRRAAVHFARNDLRASVGDLRRVLALDPNHYRALEALGQIFKETGRKAAALGIYRKLYEVHPYMSGVKSTLDELAREVDGQPA